MPAISSTTHEPPAGPRPLVIGLLLALIVIVPYLNILTGGETLVATANYHPFDEPFYNLNVADFAGPIMLNWYDLGGVWWQWEPAGKLFSKAFRAGRLPLWDPYTGGGLDAHASVTNGQYFPPFMLVLLAGDTPIQRDLYYLLLLTTAALSCYRLGRRWDFHPYSALLFAACFCWGGTTTVTLNSMMFQSIALVPLMLLLTERLMDRPDFQRAGSTALWLAVIILSSFLPVVIFGFMLAGFLLLARLAIGPLAAPRRRIFGHFALATLLAIGCTAFLLLPLQLASAANPAFQKWYEHAGSTRLPFDHLLEVLSPYLVSGDGVSNHSLFPLLLNTAPIFYIGLTPLLLLPLIRRGSSPRQQTAIVFLAFSGLFFLAKCLGWLPVNWIALLPVFRHLHFVPYASSAIALASAGLAAAGVESLLTHRPGWSRTAAVAGLLLAFWLAVLAYLQSHPMADSARVGIALSHHLMELLRLTLIAVAFFVIVLLRAWRMPARDAALLVFALCALELVPLAAHYRFLRHDVWTHVPRYVRFLQNDPGLFRIHGAHDLALTPNITQGLGLTSISSRGSLTPPRYMSLVSRYFDTAPGPYPVATTLLPRSRAILDLLNVKYVLDFRPDAAALQKLRAAGLEPAFTERSFHIFRNPTVWPRAFLAREFEVAPTPAAALEAVGRLTAPGRVVLEQPPATAIPASAAPGTAEVVGYDFDRVTIRTRSATPSLLVLLDSHAPGWTARANGRPVPILPADYAFRAVEVPAGTTLVEFRYMTPGLIAGCLLSLLSAAVSILLITRVGARLSASRAL